MRHDIPQTRDVVLVGGGHAHALFLRKWGMAPLHGVRLTLIDPEPSAPYTGMLPGHIAGHYPREALEIDLVRLARFAGARLILGRAEGLDPEAGVVRVPGRPDVAYDLLSLDIGITSDMSEIPGFAEFGTPAKPLGRLAARWRGFLDAAGPESDGPSRVAVIGGGIAGVELALAMMHALRGREARQPQVTIVEAATLLSQVDRRSAALLRGELSAAGIGWRENAVPAAITANGVELADGGRVEAGLVVGAAGARPYGWLRRSGLDLHDGYISVDATLRSLSDKRVFATGDCAYLSHAPRPKAGVFAVREAPVLYDNVVAALRGGSLRRFSPQRDYLKLVSLGDKRALADKSGLRLKGASLWWLKDRIDRAFMDKFHQLPEMHPPKTPSLIVPDARRALEKEEPLCGGCGAKVSAEVLSMALGGLGAPGAKGRPGRSREREDVLSRIGDDAAVLRVGGATQVITTDHLRAFSADPYLMARIAALHAMGDIWAMGAAPQAVLVNVTLPLLSAELQARSLSEIMAAVRAVASEAGAEVVGGHSAQGPELSLGFTMTGLHERTPVTLRGARPGDALILTRPIGSGVILAAEMAGRARGLWVGAALEEMSRSQAGAATLLGGAHAMTDVTGFGLAGHLMNMLEASGCAATLDLGALPLYDGAEELTAAGTRASLHADNRKIAARVTGGSGARAQLLFDPQTAGGLLAAVSGAGAEALLMRLIAQGHRAAIIGRIEAGAPEITLGGAG